MNERAIKFTFCSWNSVKFTKLQLAPKLTYKDLKLTGHTQSSVVTGEPQTDTDTYGDTDTEPVSGLRSRTSHLSSALRCKRSVFLARSQLVSVSNDRTLEPRSLISHKRQHIWGREIYIQSESESKPFDWWVMTGIHSSRERDPTHKTQPGQTGKLTLRFFGGDTDEYWHDDASPTSPLIGFDCTFNWRVIDVAIAIASPRFDAMTNDADVVAAFCLSLNRSYRK